VQQVLAAEGGVFATARPGTLVIDFSTIRPDVTAAAREAGVVVPVGGLVAQLMASARAAGNGGLDHSALLRGVERLSGRNPVG
jgi:3-hydroxyisobutyrate dehydrogenase-like beta-hydroxyacid dehydrogenase